MRQRRIGLGSPPPVRAGVLVAFSGNAIIPEAVPSTGEKYHAVQAFLINQSSPQGKYFDDVEQALSIMLAFEQAHCTHSKRSLAVMGCLPAAH